MGAQGLTPLGTGRRATRIPEMEARAGRRSIIRATSIFIGPVGAPSRRRPRLGGLGGPLVVSIIGLMGASGVIAAGPVSTGRMQGLEAIPRQGSIPGCCSMVVAHGCVDSVGRITTGLFMRRRATPVPCRSVGLTTGPAGRPVGGALRPALTSTVSGACRRGLASKARRPAGGPPSPSARAGSAFAFSGPKGPPLARIGPALLGPASAPSPPLGPKA